MTERIAATIFGDDGLAVDERYWTAQLAGDVRAFGVPADHKARSAGGSTIEVVERRIDPQTTTRILATCNGNPALMFTLFVAALKVCLCRYHGAEDIVVGTEPYQDIADHEPVLGWLPLRSRISGTVAVRELLSRVKRCIADAYTHQRYLTKGPSWLASPPFGVAIVFREGSDHRAVARLHGDACLVRVTRSETLDLSCEYAAEIYRRETIELFVSQCLAVVRAAIAQPHARVSELNLLDEQQRAELVRFGMGPRVPLDGQQLVHHACASEAERRPDAIAVTCDDAHVSYGELNARANRLARYLRRNGVAPEARVAVRVERGVDVAAIFLGILKAGGCYVPLDPEWPVARTTRLITAAGIVVLLTDADDVAGAVERGPLVVRMKAWPAAVEGEEDTEPASETLPENTAYVIYTSGSTGEPKGVMVSHRALANHMRWLIEEFDLTASDRVFQKTPVSFDASVWEFYAPLMTGGRLVMAKPRYHRDASYLTATARREMVSILQVVPSLLGLLLDEPEFAECRSLRKVFCGGESLSTELRRRCGARITADLVNLYGPTEATIQSSFWPCPADRPDTVTSIGRPIVNTDLYVLDSSLDLVPRGHVGEVCIGGAALATGYLNRPDATAERFVPNPRSDQPGARIYRTGDMARYRADGSLEYLGRRDLQLKISGYRIEPGEIEAALAQHDSVRSCVVVPSGNRLGQPMLAAYVERRGQRALEPADLAAFARERLPSSMVPGAFVVLDALPLTSSGKVDRHALPDPWAAQRIAAAPVPTTHMERSMTQIWKEVLNVDRVGVNDNFFDLGGNSLLLPLLQARLRTFRNIPIVDLFRYPTISSLAKYIAEDRAGSL